jgi:chemotaxis protein CheD
MQHPTANRAARRIQKACMSTLPYSPITELMPGDIAVGLVGDQLKTLLGSCVSIILTDPRRTVGAMCHIVHVGKPNMANTRNTAYGSVAMQELFARLQHLGISPKLCQAYVYGGGNMFPHLFSKRHVGDANVEWALAFLAEHHITVLHQDLGGHGYRKVAWTVGADAPMVELVLADTADNLATEPQRTGKN